MSQPSVITQLIKLTQKEKQLSTVAGLLYYVQYSTQNQSSILLAHFVIVELKMKSFYDTKKKIYF